MLRRGWIWRWSTTVASAPISDPVPLRQSAQAIFPSVNLDLGPRWEFNAGVGIGLTDATDGMLFKLILGRRLGGH